MHKQRAVIETADGSHTVKLSEEQESYHSMHGAWTESMHVFIEQGFRQVPKSVDPVHVLEIGFGTGLNGFQTWLEVRNMIRKVHYVGVEPHPLGKGVWAILNYPDFAGDEASYAFFRDLHLAPWGTPVFLRDEFVLSKIEANIQDVKLRPDSIDLIYFDAFSFSASPELWSREVFSALFHTMRHGGVLVTYASKGEVRRMMQEVGFRVERLPGPPGKREMLRGYR
ncbi:MAG TPA: tRNA (5-methylaminomethyl-2-thiouridine)(34)-methyltransferase MnmD [Bacteroidales bacterium]|nr:tRNA (5-methylaminomethyl-2-thiouridine)(34)-methyltransferase MnmD [Bacteroidales bacterium]